MKLSDLVHEARVGAPAFTAERRARVFAGMQRRRERRVARARLARRGLVLAAALGFFGLLVLRGAGASTASSERIQDPTAAATNEVVEERVAVHAANDGGYARD